MKMYLLYHRNDPVTETNEATAFSGLIHLLDYIQDKALVESELLGERIFTHEELEKDANNLNLPYEEIDDAPFVVIDSRTGQWLDAFMWKYKAQHCVALLATIGIKETRIITGEEWRAREFSDRVKVE